jgi:hypothetical protein
MANTFYRKLSRNVGTSLTAIGGYTVAADTTAVIVGLTVCNTSGATVAVDITVNDGTNEHYVVKAAPISAGGALVPIGGEQKIILAEGDSVKIKSDSASSLDAVLSIMEIT